MFRLQLFDAAKPVGEYAAELEVGVLQHALNAQTMLGDLAGQLFARTCQITQLLNRGGWHEAGADASVCEQAGDPHSIVNMLFATRHVPDACSIAEHQLEGILEYVPEGFPVHASGLHRYVGAAMARQPVR
ncbi:hypothetical protein WL99_02270 [Burkholderia cepacia]|nr:hypothetical protein WL99_02270 [Burkholderia cepacia]